jgi:hypothetical protein
LTEVQDDVGGCRERLVQFVEGQTIKELYSEDRPDCRDWT